MTVSDGASPESVFTDERVAYCLRETFDPSGFSLDSFLEKQSAAPGKAVWTLELGPRLNFTTAWSTNAVSILRAAKVSTIPRIEVCSHLACHRGLCCGLIGLVCCTQVSRRYRFETDAEIPPEIKTKIAFALHDKMTEQIYEAPMQSFESTSTPEPVTYVPILAEGRVALDRINREWGLGMDEDDVKYYTGLFRDKMQRCGFSTLCKHSNPFLTYHGSLLLQRPHER